MALITNKIKVKSYQKWLVAITIVALVISLIPANSVLAIDPLTISNITVVHTDKTATISWTTNRPASGKVMWDIVTNNYHNTLMTNQRTITQTITLLGLAPNTTYYFKVTANDDLTEVTSFEQAFTTNRVNDTTVPTISGVQVAFVTGSTATIQWYTDEDSTSEVDYGRTTTYGLNRSDGNRTKVHDITLNNLIDGTYYHFRVKSRDGNNNVATWYDMTFTTNVTLKSDKDPLLIYDIHPTSENDQNITDTTAVISWHTNKLAQGWVNYGIGTSYGRTLYTIPPRVFNNSVTLTGLKPATKYYFEVNAKDVVGSQVHSIVYSFITKETPTSPSDAASNQTNAIYGQGSNGVALGAGNCDVNISSDFGFFGMYYNLTPANPDVESMKQDVKVGPLNNWYNQEYFSFSRVDSNLIFGKGFFPVDEHKQNDPHDFAVHWRAIIDVPTTGTYAISVGSDDDSWVFIDDVLVIDLKGIHPAKNDSQQVSLNAGYHKLEIYYADRQSPEAKFNFNPDSKLKFYPLPDGCSVQDVLDYNQKLGHGIQASAGQPVQSSAGRVLGASNTTSSDPYRGYACNPDLGYTKIKALYKTTDSPDVWALLETGQRHYITSPAAFNKYQCDWNKIKLVSNKFLNQFAIASLVRTPQNPTIYRLFQRADTKWLKINIPSPTVFISYPTNFWGNVAWIDQLDVDAYPDVRLIKGPNNPNVYLIDGTNKDHVASEAVFTRMQFDWFEVATLNQIHMDSFTDGPDVQ